MQLRLFNQFFLSQDIKCCVCWDQYNLIETTFPVLVLQCGHMVCVYCKKHLAISMECPLCKAFPVNSYILSARHNTEPISTEYNIVSKLHNNPHFVNRVYEVFELLHINTVHHINDHLYCKNMKNGLDLVTKVLQYENTTIRELAPQFVPVKEKNTIDNQHEIQKKFDNLAYKYKKLEVKMLKYKLKYKCLKQTKSRK
ncbi:hypothetical protein D1Q00_gp036 [Trichoplusia ni granulovirus LBIV-12]|jgi:hypothetical protein|uniref:RING-type domain-containing protein n=2 Tax=Betabaculovirus TaxID=558017 RepID=A0A1D8QL61_GVTN|nr:hypothetical protein PsunGV_gp042 [Pseudalatia unipuncta granulovirus]YP_009506106.1 hypothetical protein D1Q00_gp036 [Trichoplusia ni granulovirus LBIV-12]ACH69392.1 unknown [Pseudalatia unipuncta granulovirus]AOW41375.1 hypothetical protein [Trichoplusia ni granulovirus LBIV-12]